MVLSERLLSRRAALGCLAVAAFARGWPAHAAVRPLVTVHRDPKCGCCGAWADHLRRAGFPVKIVETGNLDAIKQWLKVPQDLAACHTAEMQGYVIEGHVPAAAIVRLLEDRPKAAGLAVPGMPIGSPGMEGGTPETYEVVVFGPHERRTFGRYIGDREIEN